jgi:hypothetical protein
MRLPKSAHTSRPWRVHEFTRDFRIEDVWALPTPGTAGDFPRLVTLFISFDPARETPWVVRMLFAVRLKLGQRLDWDTPPRDDSSSLRNRLPADLRDGPTGPAIGSFRPLYLLEDEWALEIVNRTVHGVLHLAWVPNDRGGYRGQMAILVKRAGLLGAGYMAAITPFRYALVYPLMLRALGRSWRSQADQTG